MLEGRYLALHDDLHRRIPGDRLIHDELRSLAYGTDASFYRLIPKLVIKVESEEEVVDVIRSCRRMRTPLTFRAAGTSLAGQAITDSVLVQLGRSWKRVEVSGDASRIALQPGIIGARANLRLLPFHKKIGPDPASINAAMIGGIVANNASGMCCGTAQNSYRTLAGMRVVLADGSILDTRDAQSRRNFGSSHAGMLARLRELGRRTCGNTVLADRIRSKYKIKNTTGYSLNALVDFDDPIEILQHLMVGSEGTLGFISEVSFLTVPEHPHKATALMLFPDIRTACAAVPILKQQQVAAAELMDRASLRSVEDKEGMPDSLRALDDNAAALLVEARAADSACLQEMVGNIVRAMSHLPTVQPITFTTDVAEFSRLWNIRKGLLPSAGALRAAGTTVIIEDVAFPVAVLDRATLDCQALLRKHGYSDAVIFGHALEGNLHFVFPQSFNSDGEVERYRHFMDDLCRMVVQTYDGSLKAEHGTGRNIAPFVEMEWGRDAYVLMKEIKEILDPECLLNPGVILNDDPHIHLKNLKPMPAAHALVDKCIECGFCESDCPSRTLTLTPRQRIVVYREMARLSASGEDAGRLRRLEHLYRYDGDRTCATDGLCALECPVEIDTGKLIKHLRCMARSDFADDIASIAAEHMGAVTACLRGFLDVLGLAHRFLGSATMGKAAAAARRWSQRALPMWNPAMPRGAQRPVRRPVRGDNPLKAVYFPSCIGRSLGIAADSRHSDSQTRRTDRLLRKAGYEVIYPEHLDDLCCGMAFASKGFVQQGDLKLRELGRALIEASDGGRHPILFDTSPCLQRFREGAVQGQPLRVYDPVTFIHTFLLGRLRFRRLPQSVAIHVTCSARKMGLAGPTRSLAELCAERVIVPESVGCCAFAGDRGFLVPELNASALSGLKGELPPECRSGYSTSRTCEIGMSLHGGIPYQSLVYLVDEATEELV